MASRQDKREEKFLVDEKILHHTRDFFSRNAVKFLVLFLVVMTVVVVYVVKSHVGRVTEEDVGNWLEDNFYAVINDRGPVAGDDQAGAKALNINEVLARTEGTKQRPYVLYQLAQHLFEKGGAENLAEADRVIGLLKAGAETSTYYQTLADNLREKINEERTFQMPEASPAGPKTPEETPSAPEAGKAETPKAEAPKAEAPKAEAPKAEAPKAEAPKTEAPATAPAAPNTGATPAPAAPVPSAPPAAPSGEKSSS